MTLSLSTLDAAVFRLGMAIESDIRPWTVEIPGLPAARPAAVGCRDLDAARELIRAAEPGIRRHLCRSLRFGIWGSYSGPKRTGGAR